ncbi:MAG TPA: CopD family protein [Acidimicrobiales bacterium]|nr:CopD family protein [Acidimicrobiales bacterium]
MLADAPTIIRLSLHVLAAALWVGGQFTLAGLVPVLRRADREVAPAAGRRFAQIAWPAYGVLLATGLWNIAATHPESRSAAWQAVLFAKIAVFLLSGLSAWMHQRSTRPRDLAIWGALSGISAPAALVLGVALAG